ncbi:hemicentin-1-like isoform X2 [Myripristis murdjan]|uniref:hemicentin-1-like isoform X2 n=1 Tax=Myripristis murdjan TaxID=586833 RepID=UPI001175D57D|nr:hemicentin-1-like isoform X2 [Myripristis murdjan]
MSGSTFLRLVGFILSATGVYASCPIELNPPRVVVKYGDPVSVNCSTSLTEHEGMGWESPVGGVGLTENVDYLTWTVPRLTQWSIAPKCFINPPEPEEQCLEVLQVVLYTFPDKVTISSNAGPDGLMNEGKTYHFTCNIQKVAPVRNLAMKWYKGETLIKTDYFDNLKKEPVNQPAVLTFIPSRDDNNVQVRCEAHLDLGPETPHLSATSPEYSVSVLYGPDITCSDIDILEGEALAGRCSVAGNPAPHISWLKDGRPINPNVTLKREDTGMYTITAEGLTNASQPFHVSVLYGPEITCSDTYSAMENGFLNLACANGYPHPTITWYRDDDEVHLPEVLTKDDEGSYTIVASNQLGNVSHTLYINITYPPSEIKELENTEVEVGSTTVLKCSSTGNPRPVYSWSYYQDANVYVKNEDGVSLLHIRHASANNNGSYTCKASNSFGNVSKTVVVTVKGARAECPIKITPDRMVVPYQHRGVATCKPVSDIASNVKALYWQASQGNINGTQWSNTQDNWDARPVCVATFEGIGKCEKHLDFTMYKTPDSVSIRALNHTGPMMVEEDYQLQCDIISIAPVQILTVMWYRGNETIKSNGTLRVTGCPQDDKTGCVIRAPVNVTSTISIRLDRSHSRVEFRCEAQLDLGLEGRQPPETKSSVPLDVTVHYKPIINATKLPTRIPVFRGYPEDLVCEAEGHPTPKIQWFYSSENVIRVSEGKLTVSEAGLYTCNATNEVDSSILVVEVILKEDYLPIIAGLVAITVVGICIIFAVIYSVYYKNTKMRRYSLKNPKLSTQNGNVAHNGFDVQLPMTKLS